MFLGQLLLSSSFHTPQQLAGSQKSMGLTDQALTSTIDTTTTTTTKRTTKHMAFGNT
jgi:hypothetical protein